MRGTGLQAPRLQGRLLHCDKELCRGIAARGSHDRRRSRTPEGAKVVVWRYIGGVASFAAGYAGCLGPSPAETPASGCQPVPALAVAAAMRS